MFATITDAAVGTGKYAALRMSMRFDATDADPEEILARARAVLELSLEKMGVTDPVQIEEATAIMVDAYMTELGRLTKGKAHA